jgi:hypothetical protein
MLERIFSNVLLPAPDNADDVAALDLEGDLLESPEHLRRRSGSPSEQIHYTIAQRPVAGTCAKAVTFTQPLDRDRSRAHSILPSRALRRSESLV